MQKVGTFGSLGPISMIQPPFCSSCVALQYEPRIKFFHQAVPKLQDIRYWENSMHPLGVSFPRPLNPPTSQDSGYTANNIWV